MVSPRILGPMEQSEWQGGSRPDVSGSEWTVFLLLVGIVNLVYKMDQSFFENTDSG